MQLLNINDFIKKTIKECCYYVHISNAKFPLYSHCYQAFIAYGLYNGGKSIDVIKAFFLLIAMSNPISFVFQYIIKSVFFQLKYPLISNHISLSRWAHYFLSTVFNKRIIFAFHSFFPFWPIMSPHSFF